MEGWGRKLGKFRCWLGLGFGWAGLGWAKERGFRIREGGGGKGKEGKKGKEKGGGWREIGGEGE